MHIVTGGVSVEEMDRSSENSAKHSVVDDSRGVEEEEVEENTPDKSQQNCAHSQSCVDGNPLVGSQATELTHSCVGQVHVCDVICGAFRPSDKNTVSNTHKYQLFS